MSEHPKIIGLSDIPDLATARSTIDQIDDQLLQLISERLEVARKLRALKEMPKTAVAWAPDREHLLFQRLLAKRPQNMSSQTLVALWNALISASLQAQGPLQLLCPNPREQAIASAAFPGAPIHEINAENWLVSLQNTPGGIAFLPPPSDHQTWWAQIARTDPSLFIQAVYPKYESHGPTAYCVSASAVKILPEQTCWIICEPDMATTLTDWRKLARHGNQVLLQSTQSMAWEKLPNNSLFDPTKPPIAIAGFYPPLSQENRS